MDKKENTEALAKEVAEWMVQEFPLAGGDVLAMLCRHGILTEEQAVAAVRMAREKHGVDGGETQYVATEHDAQIPF